MQRLIEKLLPLRLKKIVQPNLTSRWILSFQINITSKRKSEVNIRTVVNLPGGTGKKVKVAVVCEDNQSSRS